MLRLALLLALAAPARAADRPTLDGTWLFDECVTGTHSALGRFWQSVVTVTGDRFTLTKLMWNEKPLTGRLVFDAADPAAVDLVLDELDFANFKVKVPGGTYRGRCDAKADRFTLAIARGPGDKRPAKLGPSNATFFAALTRAPAGFKEFPKEVTVRVSGPDGKPVGGASVATVLHKSIDPDKKDAPAWVMHDAVKTAADGTVRVRYDRPPSAVRDEAAKLIAFVTPSPASLAGGEVRVALAPECRVTGRVVSAELERLGGKVGWSNLDLVLNGQSVAHTSSIGGGFDFVAPPGEYTLGARSEDLDGRSVKIVVPPFRSSLDLGPIELKADAFALLKGKPAPPFEGVMGWAGKPVSLADLKGQYVLVEFWGFWCGPCVKHMPTLVELHETFGGKGLTVVGVHMDLGGDVDTAAKLDEKLVHVVKNVWAGKPLPFPSALVSGKRDDDNQAGGTVKRYGVMGFPTTVLIDPDGKIVGKFHARDAKDAVAQVEKLLKK